VAGGGPAPLQPYFNLDQPEGALLGGAPAQPFADHAGSIDDTTTPWATYPGWSRAPASSRAASPTSS
jgi:hypothetical protein